MGNLYISLIHYPILNRRGEITTTALTGLDVHDIARAAKTYEVKRYFIITPVPAQQGIAARIRRYWLETKVGHNRGEALELVEILGSYEESLEWIEREEGIRPLTVGTDARQLAYRYRQISYEELRARLETSPQPVYILFGTGWGLAGELLEQLDYLLPPILGPGEWNHLSVRTAAAIILDRLRGR
ncbi:TPA: RNA methyltransferase [Candidatus Bipolaricaulota bacterium]|nr:RNA methyltransferase [Candidatus Bipolaricaulota bacterium]